MPASVSLTSARHRDGSISLGEVYAREGLGEGEPIRVIGNNDGTMALRDVVVRIDGAGADFVQLAVDLEGEPGVWADRGQSISVTEETLFPGESFAFWAKAVFGPDQLEGHKDFEFVVDAVSIGS